MAVSPDTPNLPNELMSNDHGSRGGGYARVQQHGLPLTKTDLSTATASVSNTPTEETHTEPLVCHHFLG